jgi:hypothetical protein
MKVLLLSLMVLLSGCTDSTENSYKERYSSARDNLETCTSELNALKARAQFFAEGSGAAVEHTEPEAPPEPQYDDYKVYHITASNNVKDVCDEVGETQCGVSAHECKSGAVYSCLTNVSYIEKTESRKRE